MTRAAKSFGAFAFGVLLFVAGVFAWLGEDFILLVASIGLLVLLVGAGALLSAQSRVQLRYPHPAVYGLLARVWGRMTFWFMGAVIGGVVLAPFTWSWG